MQTYFSVCYPDEPREFRAVDVRLRRQLIRTAVTSTNGTGARLRPEVAATILRNNADDLSWLASEEGIVFDGLDTSCRADAPLPPEREGTVLFSDIVEVRPDDVQALAAQAARRAATRILALEKRLVLVTDNQSKLRQQLAETTKALSEQRMQVQRIKESRSWKLLSVLLNAKDWCSGLFRRTSRKRNRPAAH